MKILLCALLAVPASAAAPTLETAFPSARLTAKTAAVQAERRSSSVDVRACFVRRDDAEADRLGLPKRFCLDKLTLSMPSWAELPFVDEASMDAEGTPAYRHLHIDGGARETDGWTIDAGLVSLWGTKDVCGRLNSAHATVYARIDLKGNLVPGPVEVRGFLMDGSALCQKPAPTVDFEYQKL